MDTKKCPCCKDVKGLEEFRKNKYTKSGVHTQCKACEAARLRDYRLNQGNGRAMGEDRPYAVQSVPSPGGGRVIKFGDAYPSNHAQRNQSAPFFASPIAAL